MSSLVVNTNMTAIDTLNDVTKTNNAETSAINRLSSGLQISGAATGPAQYVISQSLESEASGYSTAISNAQDGVSLIQTATGALSQVSSILQTMEQLALTSANGATLTTTSEAANEDEFQALKTDITQIAKTTTFGTTHLLTGSFSGKTLQVGAFDTSTTKANNQIKLTIASVTATALSLGTVTLAASGGATVTVYTSTAGTTTSTYEAGTAAATNAAAAVTAVQKALKAVDTSSAKLGATQNELQAMVANLTVGQQNLQSADSQLVDVTMAKEMTTYSTDEILMQSGVAMLAQAQQLPSLVLSLMGT